MANKVLGKISAVLSVNPTPWRKGLDSSRESLSRWAKTVDSQIRGASSSAEKSFNSIITPLQRLNKALDAGVGSKLKFRGLEQSADQIRSLAVAADQVAKPLAGAVKQFQGLSTELQSGFAPALNRAQAEVARLENLISSGAGAASVEKQFQRATASVEKTTAAIRRLKQAQSTLGGFATGQELQFQNPKLAGALDAGRAASQRATQFGGDPAVNALVVDLNVAATKAVELSASLEAARARGLRTDVNDIGARLENQLFIVRSLSSELNELGDSRAASRRLNILADMSDRPTAATQLPAGYLQSRAEEAARRQIGVGGNDSLRLVDQLGQKIVSLRGQIDALPSSIGTTLVPQLKAAENSFIRIRTSASRSSEEIESASTNVQRLASQVNRISATQGLKSFADGLDDSALRGAIGNLQALEQILNRVGATAGSEAAAQFDRMRAAIQRATADGTIGSEAFQNELRQISQEAAKAAAATGKIRTGAAFREIKRGGDIARGGFDKLSLGLQQAAFAIDDFFSATGDISQKIRAVQNNVTQLAFVVGETKGLFIGLGVAIAAQATVALIKWLNAGVEAKDRTEALNQALARQKSLVEELKTAFESLTDSLTRGIFSDQLEEAIALGRELDGIRKKAEELRREQAAALDPAVNQERALQASLQDRLDRETDAGQRIALERQITASRRRENSAADAAVNRQVDADEVGKSLLEGISRQFSGRESDETVRVSFLPVPGVDFRDFAEDGRRADFSQQSEAERRRFEGELNQAGGNPLELARILESRLEELASRSRELDQSATPRQAERKAINEQIVEIERNLQDLEAPIRAAILDLGLELLEGSTGIRDSLGRSREIIDSSLGGFGPLAREQDKLAQEYKRIQDELRRGLDGSGEQLTQEGIKERKRELEALRENVSGLESAARSTKAFAEALDRVASNLADTVLGEARSAEEQARREENRRQAELDSLPADATPAERAQADLALFNAQVSNFEAGLQADQIEDERRRIRADRRRAEEKFQRDARAGNLGPDLQRDIAERDGLRAKVDSGEATADERNRLDRLEASIARSFETSAPGRDLTRRSDELDQQQQRNNITRDRRRAELEEFQQTLDRRRQSIDRGQELLKTPQQQAAEQGLSQFDDAVNASLSNVAAELQQIAPNLPELADGILSLEELGGLFSRFPQLKATLEGEFLENLQTARDNISGNVAEQVAQFDEERSKVSRQAIQAQDVNTQQGRAELNRMLRGDDANRDKPILQGLEKQLQVLNAIDQRILDVTTVIGTAGP